MPGPEARRRAIARGIVGGILGAPLVIVATWSLFVLLTAAGGPR